MEATGSSLVGEDSPSLDVNKYAPNFGFQIWLAVEGVFAVPCPRRDVGYFVSGRWRSRGRAASGQTVDVSPSSSHMHLQLTQAA